MNGKLIVCLTREDVLCRLKWTVPSIIPDAYIMLLSLVLSTVIYSLSYMNFYMFIICIILMSVVCSIVLDLSHLLYNLMLARFDAWMNCRLDVARVANWLATQDTSNVTVYRCNDDGNIIHIKSDKGCVSCQCAFYEPDKFVTMGLEVGVAGVLVTIPCELVEEDGSFQMTLTIAQLDVDGPRTAFERSICACPIAVGEKRYGTFKRC